jgi:hypothetical protein
MSNAIDADHRWLLNSSRAELHAGALYGQLDLSRPELGVGQLTIDGQPFNGSFFGVLPCAQTEPGVSPPATDELSRSPRQVADAYVRGGDLIAAYRPTPEWPYATQIYWQITYADRAAHLLSSMSLLVSLQTHLLDTWPTMCIETRLAADEVLHLDCATGKQNGVRVLSSATIVEHSGSGACCILYRLGGMPLTYVEMMEGSDMRQVSIRRGDDRICHARWELFAEFLEKGVIRRARMHALLVPRSCDTELARAAYNALQLQPLPLTA